MLRDLTSMGPKSLERMLGIRAAIQTNRQEALEEKQHAEKEAKKSNPQKELEAKKAQSNSQSFWDMIIRDRDIRFLHSSYGIRIIEDISIGEDRIGQVMLEFRFDQHTMVYHRKQYEAAIVILGSYELLLEHDNYYCGVVIQDLNSLNSALSAILEIENSAQMVVEEIRSRIEPLVKHKTTLKNWMKKGDIVPDHVATSIASYVIYKNKNSMPTKFKSVTLQHFRNPSHCLLILENKYISQDELRSLRSTVGEGDVSLHQLRIAILSAERLMVILEKVEKVDRSVAYISEDLVHHYDSNYANERKQAILSGLYCKSGKTPSSIFNVFSRNTNLADRKIFGNIFSFLFVSAPNKKTTTNKTTLTPKNERQERCIIC